MARQCTARSCGSSRDTTATRGAFVRAGCQLPAQCCHLSSTASAEALQHPLHLCRASLLLSTAVCWLTFEDVCLKPRKFCFRTAVRSSQELSVVAKMLNDL